MPARSVWTLVVLATVVAMCISVVVSLPLLNRLSIQDDPRQLLRSSGQWFSEYEQFASSFPHENYETTLVVTGDLLTPAAISTVDRTSRRIEKLQAVNQVFTYLSIPGLQDLAGKLVSEEVVVPSVVSAELRRVDPIAGVLLSEDGRSAIVQIALMHDVVSAPSALQATLTDIREILDEEFATANIDSLFAGFPVLRTELRQQILTDLTLTSVLSMVLAAIVAYWFYRSVVVLGAALLAPVLSVLWTHSLLAVTGIGLNLLTQLVFILIVVIGFSASMHFLHFLRLQLASGRSAREATVVTYQVLGLPGLSSVLTSAAGFLSLTFSQSWAMKEFGIICAIGCLFGFAALMIGVPLLAVVLDRHGPTLELKQSDRVHQKAPITRSGPTLLERKGVDVLIIVTASGVTLVFFLLAVFLKPDYRLGENLSTSGEINTAMTMADQRLNGIVPLHYMVSWPQTDQNDGKLLKQRLRFVRNLETLLENETGKVWLSSIDFLAYAPGMGSSVRFKSLPLAIAQRQFDRENGRALVSTTISATGSRALKQTLEQLQSKMKSLSADSGVIVKPVGLAVLATEASQNIVRDLVLTVVVALALVLFITSLMFRSFRVGLICLVPNIAPVLFAAALLVMLGEPLRYSTVIVFSICLGLAVDDSIHLLARFNHYLRLHHSVKKAVGLALKEIRQVLLYSSVMLCAGFAVLLFSSTETLVVVGILAIGSLGLALVFDLLVLPAMIRRWFGDSDGLSQ